MPTNPRAVSFPAVRPGLHRGETGQHREFGTRKLVSGPAGHPTEELDEVARDLVPRPRDELVRPHEHQLGAVAASRFLVRVGDDGEGHLQRRRDAAELLGRLV